MMGSGVFTGQFTERAVLDAIARTAPGWRMN